MDCSERTCLQYISIHEVSPWRYVRGFLIVEVLTFDRMNTLFFDKSVLDVSGLIR